MRLILTLILVTVCVAIAVPVDAQQSSLPGESQDRGNVGEGDTPTRPGGDDNVVVPEPATLALIGTGLVALGIARRRRKEKK